MERQWKEILNYIDHTLFVFVFSLVCFVHVNASWLASCMSICPSDCRSLYASVRICFVILGFLWVHVSVACGPS